MPVYPVKPICALDDLAEVDCKEFTLSESNPDDKGFIVKIHERVFAYKNCCPHARVPLNWEENKFLDIFGSYILCSLHGALFQIHNGLCIHGPCEGRFLQPIATRIIDNRIYHGAGQGDE
ncbi:MAG: Rieske (2Fe-2S) protein [Gammaproteobacteria bacterium]